MTPAQQELFWKVKRAEVQTPEQKQAGAAAGVTGQTEATIAAKLPTEIQQILQTSTVLNRLKSLSKEAYSGAGSEAKTTLGRLYETFGFEPPDKAVQSEVYLAQFAELLKERLQSKAYGVGTGVSNLDLLAAKQPLPKLANTEKGREEIINAIEFDLKTAANDKSAQLAHWKKNKNFNDFEFPSMASGMDKLNNKKVVNWGDLPQ
jgi:hypothetical protein